MWFDGIEYELNPAYAFAVWEPVLTGAVVENVTVQVVEDRHESTTYQQPNDEINTLRVDQSMSSYRVKSGINSGRL